MIYLDHASTTPVDKQVLNAMLPYFSQDFGNASSLHQFGQKSAEAVKNSREIIANFLNCQAGEIIFTSGATEANNLAIMGLIPWTEKIHIITTAIEHPAILEVCQHLEKTQHAEVTYIKPETNGIVDPQKIKSAIKDNTKLISIMYANNEIGTVQPIDEIAKVVKEKNPAIVFHTDATQAVNYLDMNVEKLGVDLLSFSGHKIYGPKGVGALFVKAGTKIKPIVFGGHHEKGLRSGTLNVPGIVGLGEAVKLISTRDSAKISELRDYAWQKIQEKIPSAKLNGDETKRLPNNLNFSIVGVEGEAILLALDLAGIAISTGSACSSGTLDPSHVLMAIGLSHEQAHGSLRITFGKDNTQKEVDIFIDKLFEIVNNLKKVGGDFSK